MWLLASQIDSSFIRAYGWPMLATLGVTLVAVPVVRTVAMRLGLYDRPDSGLKPHERPIPYLGGVGMFAGWLAALAWTLPASSGGGAELLWIALGGTALMLTGLIDDIRHLPPKTRLIVQALVAAGLVYGGIGDGVARSLLNPISDLMPAFVSQPVIAKILSWGVCAFILAGASNSTNLIDGLDGLCAGVLGISAAGFLALSILLNRTVGADTSETLRSALAIGVAGACIGFLFYNFNPATIFMGDSGSLLLGYNVALLLILFAEQGAWRWLIGAVLIFGFPIYDTALAITRRWMNGKRLFVGDRSHYYDQLRDRGRTVRQTVLLCYLIGLVLAGVGLSVVSLSPVLLVAVAVLCPVAAALLSRRYGLLKVDDSAARSKQS